MECPLCTGISAGGWKTGRAWLRLWDLPDRVAADVCAPALCPPLPALTHPELCSGVDMQALTLACGHSPGPLSLTPWRFLAVRSGWVHRLGVKDALASSDRRCLSANSHTGPALGPPSAFQPPKAGPSFHKVPVPQCSLGSAHSDDLACLHRRASAVGCAADPTQLQQLHVLQDPLPPPTPGNCPVCNVQRGGEKWGHGYRVPRRGRWQHPHQGGSFYSLSQKGGGE